MSKTLLLFLSMIIFLASCKKDENKKLDFDKFIGQYRITQFYDDYYKELETFEEDFYIEITEDRFIYMYATITDYEYDENFNEIEVTCNLTFPIGFIPFNAANEFTIVEDGEEYGIRLELDGNNFKMYFIYTEGGKKYTDYMAGVKTTFNKAAFMENQCDVFDGGWDLKKKK